LTAVYHSKPTQDSASLPMKPSYSWTRHRGKSRSLRCSLMQARQDFCWPPWDRIVGYLFQNQNLLFNNKKFHVNSSW